MPLLAAELKTYPSASTPTDDVTTSGGAIDTGAGEISQASLGALIPTSAVVVSGGDVDWYYKAFRKNENGAGFNLTGSPVAYAVNGLKDNPLAGTASIVSDDATETSGKVRLYGYAGAVATTEDLNLNGTTSVNGAVVWDAASLIWGQRLSAGGALTNAIGNITITRGSALGIIPIGVNCAVAIDIGLDGSVDATTSSTDRLTAPVGITFSRAVDSATGIALPADLDDGQALGYWFKFTRKQDTGSPVKLTPVGYLFPVIRFEGNSS